MTNISWIRRYLQGANWLLVIYLSVMISGCSFRPAELSPEEARILQTREFNGTPEDIAKAVIVVLQGMHYTLGDVDMGLGIITAERLSERRLAPISREAITETEIEDGVKTFFIIAGVAVVIGFILALVFGDSEDDEEDKDDEDERKTRRYRSHRHRPSHVYVDSDNYGSDSYKYNMTITMEEISFQQTRVRVTVQGQHLEGMSVRESGPVQAQQFYIDFFNRLQTELNLMGG